MDPYLVWKNSKLLPFTRELKDAYLNYERRFTLTNRKIAELSKKRGYLSLNDRQREIVEGYFQWENDALAALYKEKQRVKEYEKTLTQDAYLAERDAN